MGNCKLEFAISKKNFLEIANSSLQFPLFLGEGGVQRCQGGGSLRVGHRTGLPALRPTGRTAEGSIRAAVSRQGTGLGVEVPLQKADAGSGCQGTCLGPGDTLIDAWARVPLAYQGPSQGLVASCTIQHLSLLNPPLLCQPAS